MTKTLLLRYSLLLTWLTVACSAMPTAARQGAKPIEPPKTTPRVSATSPEAQAWLEASSEAWFMPSSLSNGFAILECAGPESSLCAARRAYRVEGERLREAPDLLAGLNSWRVAGLFGALPDDLWANASRVNESESALLVFRDRAWRVADRVGPKASIDWLARFRGGAIARITLANGTQTFFSSSLATPTQLPSAEPPPFDEDEALHYERPRFVPHVFRDGTLVALYHYGEHPGLGLWGLGAGLAEPILQQFNAYAFSKAGIAGRVQFSEPGGVTFEAWSVPDKAKLSVRASLGRAGWELRPTTNAAASSSFEPIFHSALCGVDSERKRVLFSSQRVTGSLPRVRCSEPTP